MLKWRQKRNFRKRTAHLADHKDIFGYQNDNNDVQSSNSKEASRDPEPSLNTIPVTPPYRPEVRQAQKRNSWIDERGLPAGVTYADFTVPRQQSDCDPGVVDPGLQPQYGAVRRNMPLPGGIFDQQHPGGAFDPMRMHSGYEQPFDPMRMNRGYPQDFGPVRQDSFSARATTAAPPPRNRHFPPGQGTAYAHENPYPYMPTGPR